jgi:hypothetical protein
MIYSSNPKNLDTGGGRTIAAKLRSNIINVINGSAKK